MSRKHFSALLIGATLVVIAVALLVPERTGRNGLPGSELIFPGLQERINQADRVTIEAGGGQVVATLSRGAEDWVVEEMAGYPARWTAVRDLLAGLAQARVVEVKTRNPEYYDRLGVEDVATEGATGLLVTIGLGEDEEALIVGKEADGRGGRYLRPAGSAQSLLSDFDAEVPETASGWVEREVANIPAADVAEVEIEHPDGDRIHVLKAAEDDTDFSLENLPASREPASSWAVNSMGGILAALQLDSVDSEGSIDWEGATRVSLRTFAGMRVSIYAVLRGEDHWIRLGASGVQPAADDTGAEQSAAPDGEEPAAAEEDDQDAGTDGLQAEVDAFNARVAGWAYRIPAYKFEAMTKRLEDVLKQPDEDTD